MKVAAIQHDIIWESPGANFERLSPLVDSAARSGADLVVLAEMFSCGFSMNVEKVAEAPDGPSVDFLRSCACEHGLWVAGSVPIKTEPRTKPTNQLVVAGARGELFRYDKVHPFTYAKEDEYFEAGSDLVTVDLDGVRTALFVCYDLRFSNEFWGLAPEVDLFIVVANWPEKRREHWRCLLKARAIENQAYVVGVNRVGTGGGASYSGDTMIVDPLGTVLAEGPDYELTLLADVDASLVARTRARFPFLADRR